MKISQFLQLDPAEEEYFLLLVHHGRAGSRDLEKHYETRMKEVLERRKEIDTRVKSDAGVSESDQMLYYSSWYYTAIHMCLMVPGLQTKKSISEYLGISIQAVANALGFLKNCGMVEQRGDRFVSGPTRIHLPSESPLIAKHHTNWRMKAIQSLDKRKDEDLHYSLIMSMSAGAAEKMRVILLNAIQEIEPILRQAEDQGVYALNMDLFGLSG